MSVSQSVRMTAQHSTKGHGRAPSGRTWRQHRTGLGAPSARRAPARNTQQAHHGEYPALHSGHNASRHPKKGARVSKRDPLDPGASADVYAAPTRAQGDASLARRLLMVHLTQISGTIPHL